MHNELTENDIKKMKEEIEHRLSEVTPKLKAELQAARELGDLSENYEYRAAKRELSKNYSRLRYLYRMIDTAVVIKNESTPDTVGLYDRVTIFCEDEEETQEVTVVTTVRRDVLSGYISKESPLGSALLGHRVGDRLLITAPNGYTYYIVIRVIQKGSDDGSIELNSY